MVDEPSRNMDRALCPSVKCLVVRRRRRGDQIGYSYAEVTDTTVQRYLEAGWCSTCLDPLVARGMMPSSLADLVWFGLTRVVVVVVVVVVVLIKQSGVFKESLRRPHVLDLENQR